MNSFLRSSILEAIPTSLVTGRCAPVLTYHACYRMLPPNVAPVDNVSPEILHDQLSSLQRRYRFIPIDEFCEAHSWKGIASVTFDDGYKSVLDAALPVFESLGIPFTVFVGKVGKVGLERKMFWRHKVMYVLQNGLERECERSFSQTRKIPGQSFHLYLKHACNNSMVVEQEIDEFLRSRDLDLSQADGLIDDESWFLDHPLVWYGNHTSNHYVLSSLPYRDQLREIADVQRYLGGLKSVKVSQAFALPFGETQHFNDDTLTALRDLGYRCLLMNRGCVNRGWTERGGVRVVERFSALEGAIEPQLKRAFLRTTLSL